TANKARNTPRITIPPFWFWSEHVIRPVSATERPAQPPGPLGGQDTAQSRYADRSAAANRSAQNLDCPLCLSLGGGLVLLADLVLHHELLVPAGILDRKGGLIGDADQELQVVPGELLGPVGVELDHA